MNTGIKYTLILFIKITLVMDLSAKEPVCGAKELTREASTSKVIDQISITNKETMDAVQELKSIITEMKVRVEKLEKTCKKEVNEVFSSCAEAYMRRHRVNGIYNLTSGPHYCHMEEMGMCGGFGWQLILNVDGKSPTFAHDSVFWENAATFGHKKGIWNPLRTEAKYEGYNSDRFSSICIAMFDDTVPNPVFRYLKIAFEASSFRHLMVKAAEKPIKLKLQRSLWTSLIPDFTLQPNCNENGFGVKFDGHMKIRIGIAGNNEKNCVSTDSGLGIGYLNTHRSSGYKVPNYYAGGICACCGCANGKPRRALVFIK